jgi:hypothetical protein
VQFSLPVRPSISPLSSPGSDEFPIVSGDLDLTHNMTDKEINQSSQAEEIHNNCRITRMKSKYLPKP